MESKPDDADDAGDAGDAAGDDMAMMSPGWIEPPQNCL